jgi:hypothetical protein
MQWSFNAHGGSPAVLFPHALLVYPCRVREGVVDAHGSLNESTSSAKANGVPAHLARRRTFVRDLIEFECHLLQCARYGERGIIRGAFASHRVQYLEYA